MSEQARYALSMRDRRRKDAREKIILGGLVVKAGLRDAEPALLLGALIEARSVMDEAARSARMRALGVAALGTG